MTTVDQRPQFGDRRIVIERGIDRGVGWETSLEWFDGDHWRVETFYNSDKAEEFSRTRKGAEKAARKLQARHDAEREARDADPMVWAYAPFRGTWAADNESAGG